MTDVAASDFRLPHRYVRLDTILRLRWLAALGQLTAIFISDSSSAEKGSAPGMLPAIKQHERQICFIADQAGEFPMAH